MNKQSSQSLLASTKTEILKSLVSSFRIEGITIHRAKAEAILKKIELTQEKPKK